MDRALVSKVDRAFNKACAISGSINGGKTLTMDELKAMDCQNSDVITLEITNGNVGDVFLVLGTPLGLTAESKNFAALLASIGDVATEPAFSPLITDNQGLNATFISAINSRVVRNPIFCHDIQVISTDDAQRAESLKVLNVPYNSASDAYQKASNFIPVDTEFTGAHIAGQGAVIGEFHGLIYKLKAGKTVSMNIFITAHAVPTFKACN